MRAAKRSTAVLREEVCVRDEDALDRYQARQPVVLAREGQGGWDLLVINSAI